MGHPIGYRVRVLVGGTLSASWSAVFGAVTLSDERDGTTLMSGVLDDQAALHGLLDAVRDLGLALVSIEATVFQPSAPLVGGTAGPAGTGPTALGPGREE
jgi:hypothetical protein